MSGICTSPVGTSCAVIKIDVILLLHQQYKNVQLLLRFWDQSDFVSNFRFQADRLAIISNFWHYQISKSNDSWLFASITWLTTHAKRFFVVVVVRFFSCFVFNQFRECVTPLGVCSMAQKTEMFTVLNWILVWRPRKCCRSVPWLEWSKKIVLKKLNWRLCWQFFFTSIQTDDREIDPKKISVLRRNT